MKSAQFNHQGERYRKTLFHKDINLLVFQIYLTRTDSNYIYHQPLLMFYSVILEGKGNYIAKWDLVLFIHHEVALKTLSTFGKSKQEKYGYISKFFYLTS